MKKNLILTDGYSKETLACVWSFSEKICFIVGCSDTSDISYNSKFSEKKFLYTSPRENVKKYIDDLNTNIGRYNSEAIIPITERSIIPCDVYRNRINAEVILASSKSIDLVINKSKTLELASKLGIKTPRTEFFDIKINDSIEDLSEKINCNFPFVIKRESSERLINNQMRSGIGPAAEYIYDRNDLFSKIYCILDISPNFMVQQFIDGYEIDICGLWNEGQPEVLYADKRVRDNTPLGGPAALIETVPLPRQITELTVDLMEKINWSGPAQIEFKVDRKTGCFYLMEINGRFWGSVLGAMKAGIDFPYLYWKLINSKEILEDEKKYTIGFKGRYLVGDTKNLILTLKGKPSCWPGYFPSKKRAVFEWMYSFLDKNTRLLLLNKEDLKIFFKVISNGGNFMFNNGIY